MDEFQCCPKLTSVHTYRSLAWVTLWAWLMWEHSLEFMHFYAQTNNNSKVMTTPFCQYSYLGSSNIALQHVNFNSSFILELTLLPPLQWTLLPSLHVNYLHKRDETAVYILLLRKSTQQCHTACPSAIHLAASQAACILCGLRCWTQDCEGAAHTIS